MKCLPVAILPLLIITQMAAQSTEPSTTFDAAVAERVANLALACVHKEYPNKLSHSLASDADVALPRKLTPAFYGCYDWHSSVHGHWLLARLVRTFPNAPFVPAAREALHQSLTVDNLAQEAAYLRASGRASFERPYGLASLLTLVAELREWDDPQAREMAANLHPLEEAALERLNDWLPKLSHPVRIGEHSQTAFALGLRSIMPAPSATRNSPTCWHRGRVTFISTTRIARSTTSPQAKIFSRPALAKLISCGASFPATSLPAGCELFRRSFPPRKTPPGFSPWFRPIRAIRSSPIWTASI